MPKANARDAVRPDQALVPASLDEVATLAQRLTGSTLLPPGLQKTADLAVTILQGLELGLKPMQAIRSIHVVEGRPVLSADLIVALVMRSGVCDYFQLIESTADRAVYETQRAGAPKPTRLAWTMADAERAGLAKRQNWQRHPAAMLRARCKAALAREVYPDIAMGVYEHGEGEELASPPRVARRTEERFVDGKRRSVNVAPLPLAPHDPLTSRAQDVDDDLPQWAGGPYPDPALENEARDATIEAEVELEDLDASA